MFPTPLEAEGHRKEAQGTSKDEANREFSFLATTVESQGRTSPRAVLFSFMSFQAVVSWLARMEMACLAYPTLPLPPSSHAKSIILLPKRMYPVARNYNLHATHGHTTIIILICSHALLETATDSNSRLRLVPFPTYHNFLSKPRPFLDNNKPSVEATWKWKQKGASISI